MPSAYNNPSAAASFGEFLDSEDGHQQRKLLFEKIAGFLPNDVSAKILDACCGQGWLSTELNTKYNNIDAFDASQPLIEQAKKNHPEINFQVADVTSELPYAKNYFDVAILNMAVSDIDNLGKAFKNLYGTLKPGGKLIMTLGNPYYAFPVGVWKRGILGRLLGRKPQLKLRPYHDFTRQGQQLRHWHDNLKSYFYPLPDYINFALANNFALTHMEDLKAPQDSKTFNFHFKAYRFPTILLLVFEKGAK